MPHKTTFFMTINPGGHVAVVLEPDGDRFRLRVLDDGPGVPDDALARLTERSYRADDARTRSPGGQGLGLSIAREVAQRHGFETTLRRSDAGGLEVELQGPPRARSSHPSKASTGWPLGTLAGSRRQSAWGGRAGRGGRRGGRRRGRRTRGARADAAPPPAGRGA